MKNVNVKIWRECVCVCVCVYPFSVLENILTFSLLAEPVYFVDSMFLHKMLHQQIVIQRFLGSIPDHIWI
jgi:hypothetical protein